MNYIITGDLYERLDGKLFEIKRQICQQNGYPFDSKKLNQFLQLAIEGRFVELFTDESVNNSEINYSGENEKDVLDAKLFEIKRQMRQSTGYPHDPKKLNQFLQLIIEGKFVQISGGKLLKSSEVINILGPHKPFFFFKSLFHAQKEDREIIFKAVKKSVSELGFVDGEELSKIYKEALKRKLELFEDNEAPTAAEYYGEKAKEEKFVLIAMKPKENKHGYECLDIAGAIGKAYFGEGGWGVNYETFFEPEQEFLFKLPIK